MSPPTFTCELPTSETDAVEFPEFFTPDFDELLPESVTLPEFERVDVDVDELLPVFSRDALPEFESEALPELFIDALPEFASDELPELLKDELPEFASDELPEPERVCVCDA